MNGDQITLLVVCISTKNGKSKKEQKRYIFMVYLFKGLVAIGEKKMDMETPYKTSLYINNLCPTHSLEKNLSRGGLGVGSFRVLTSW